MSGLIEALIYIIQTLGSLYLLIVLLRFILQLVRADFYNPLSQFIVKATQPLLTPLRRIIPGFAGLDLASLILALLVWRAIARRPPAPADAPHEGAWAPDADDARARVGSNRLGETEEERVGSAFTRRFPGGHLRRPHGARAAALLARAGQAGHSPPPLGFETYDTGDRRHCSRPPLAPAHRRRGEHGAFRVSLLHPAAGAADAVRA